MAKTKGPGSFMEISPTPDLHLQQGLEDIN